MPKRRVTCNLEDSTLATCVYFIEETEGQVQGRTPANVVELSLQVFTTFLQAEGLVPEEGIPNPTEYLNVRLKAFPESSQRTGLKESLQQALKTDKVSQDKEIVSGLVDSALEYQTPKTIPEPVDVPEEVPLPVDLSSPPWEGVDVIPFADLQAASPKDFLIEKITEEPDPLLQKAVEVVYAIYPPVHWGSEKCVKLVAATYEKFKPYKELLEDGK